MASIFSKIIAGEIPAHKIAENDDFLAFLDIMPLKEGHTLVIPKKETDYIFDLNDKALADMMVFAKEIIPCALFDDYIEGVLFYEIQRRPNCCYDQYDYSDLRRSLRCIPSRVKVNTTGCDVSHSSRAHHKPCTDKSEVVYNRCEIFGDHGGLDVVNLRGKRRIFKRICSCRMFTFVSVNAQISSPHTVFAIRVHIFRECKARCNLLLC